MRAPAYWGNPPDRPGWQARALAPLAALWGMGAARRQAKGPGADCGVPVICVGNLVAGGAGKTPTVIALAEMLKAAGRNPFVLSRGYGGSARAPVRVDEVRHRAGEVGDEPLLCAAFAPTVVAADRAAGAALAVRDGADAIVLDDGFQDPSLAKTRSFLVVDAGFGFGNRHMIPAGPLREPIAAGLARADAMVVIGDEAQCAPFKAEFGDRLPVIAARLEVLPMGIAWEDQRVFAFAGIGRPAKFFDTLRGLGATLAGAVALDDHQPLSPALLTRLAREADAAGAQLVTTEKDAVRLPPDWRARVLTLPVRLRFADEGAVRALLP